MFRSTATVIVSVFGIAFVASATSSSADNDRIIGGRNASPGEFPYQASIQSDGNHFCGGSIVAPTIILTAGHCIKAIKDRDMTNLAVRVGSNKWSSGGQIRQVVGMKEHPNYNPDTKEFDAGLLKLDSPIKYDKYAQPIDLADSVPTDGKIGIITGWGVTTEQGSIAATALKAAEVTSITRKNCSQPPWNYGAKILPSMICAHGNGKDACQGDSGGPYVGKVNGKLWGLVSWGNGCAQANYPGVYTVVAAIRKWILRNAENFEN